MAGHERDPQLTAGIDMLRRTGAADVSLRSFDDDDLVVWVVVVRYRMANGRPQPTGPITNTEVAAGSTPLEAVLRLCERVMDGGECAHCHRPVMFEPDFNPSPLDALIAATGICMTTWDPELKTYRRDCEGGR